jgi:DEAD/DEAH box helicase domain-containing protein
MPILKTSQMASAQIVALKETHFRRSSRRRDASEIRAVVDERPKVTARDNPELVSRLGYRIVDTAILPGRQGSFAPLPDRLPSALKRLLTERFPRGLYRHQAEAIDAVIDGKDVCLATSTASGKSLIFMSAAAHLLEREKCARVLALYPARALIQDQKSKWEALLRPLGLSVGCIDGSVPVAQRIAILRASRVVLMTPDVAHAWLLSHVAERPVAAFLGGIRAPGSR